MDSYEASSGMEYFICCCSKDRSILYGFARLRLSQNNFQNAAFIRELHVYGNISDISNKGNEHSTQHKGIGKNLMNIAEVIAYCNGYNKYSVISGVGVREYYKKLGYKFQETGQYMTKQYNFWQFCIGLYKILFLLVPRII